jgi:hypothetical protein
MVSKRGRPSKSGERYKCGKLKPAETSKQPISPALWQRIKTNGQKIGLDPRLGTELGRLTLHDELTSAKVSAGFRIAEIYYAFEHFHGRTRSAAGSSFFRQFVADLEKPIELNRRRSDDYIDLDFRGSSGVVVLDSRLTGSDPEPSFAALYSRRALKF